MGSLPLKNTEYIFYAVVGDLGDLNQFKINPTIAAGDFQVSIDGSAFANLSTLPVVTPTGSETIKITLSAAEMNGDKVNVLGKDISGGQWQSVFIPIDVPSGNVESLTDLQEGDRIESNVRLIINKAGTSDALLDKKITGSLLTPNVTIRTTDTP